MSPCIDKTKQLLISWHWSTSTDTSELLFINIYKENWTSTAKYYYAIHTQSRIWLQEDVATCHEISKGKRSNDEWIDFIFPHCTAVQIPRDFTFP